jgi:hypothetical protein
MHNEPTTTEVMIPGSLVHCKIWGYDKCYGIITKVLPVRDAISLGHHDYKVFWFHGRDHDNLGNVLCGEFLTVVSGVKQ